MNGARPGRRHRIANPGWRTPSPRRRERDPRGWSPERPAVRRSGETPRAPPTHVGAVPEADSDQGSIPCASIESGNIVMRPAGGSDPRSGPAAIVAGSVPVVVCGPLPLTPLKLLPLSGSPRPAARRQRADRPRFSVRPPVDRPVGRLRGPGPPSGCGRCTGPRAGCRGRVRSLSPTSPWGSGPPARR